MAMNRRNVLIGLGTVAAGGGAVLGTGAFSTVEASRTVTVDTAGDSAAFLGVSVNGDYATDGEPGEDAVQIDLGDSDSSDGFNDDAITTVNDILTLTNNTADDSSITVGFDNGSSSQTASRTVVVETDNSSNVLTEVEFNLAEDDGSSKQLTSASPTVNVNATVRTGSETDGSDSTADKSEGTLTLIAN